MLQKMKNKITYYFSGPRRNMSLIVLGVLILVLFLFRADIGYNFSRVVKKIRNEKPEPVIIYRDEVSVKILEGWTNSDLDKELRENVFPNWQESDFLNSVGAKRTYQLGEEQVFSTDWTKDFNFLASKPENLSLEGYLFPDTYRFFASSSPQELVRKMLVNFDNKITDEMMQEINRQGKTLHEVITMASIIEKEAPIFNQSNKEDASLVSGIFWKRLEIGMALQSDATLSYIYENKKPTHNTEELKVKSPYNTYLLPGLPPGPICNPGLIAIEAAIYPQQSNYLYFLTPLDGSRVHYAASYQEHLNNKYKYLK